jgi:hypothetical protein
VRDVIHHHRRNPYTHTNGVLDEDFPLSLLFTSPLFLLFLLQVVYFHLSFVIFVMPVVWESLSICELHHDSSMVPNLSFLCLHWNCHNPSSIFVGVGVAGFAMSLFFVVLAMFNLLFYHS